MSRHTSWHAGGHAELYFSPRDRADLASLIRSRRCVFGHAVNPRVNRRFIVVGNDLAEMIESVSAAAKLGGARHRFEA